MKLLYIGDIMGEFGRWAVERELPRIKREYNPDVILAQGENVTHGSGLNIDHYQQLRDMGIDGFMSGNHILARKETNTLLADPNHPVTRPANCPEGTPGLEYKILPTVHGDIALISLLGQLVGKDAGKEVKNPLHVIDELLQREEVASRKVKVVNFHGDYSSEKVVIGQYLDGKVTAVVGDHWHIPTADARVLPEGTAHISDVGMVGSLDSSLGVNTDVIIKRWREGEMSSNQLEDAGTYQFCGLYVEIDSGTGQALRTEQILRTGSR